MSKIEYSISLSSITDDIIFTKLIINLSLKSNHYYFSGLRSLKDLNMLCQNVILSRKQLLWAKSITNLVERHSMQARNISEWVSLVQGVYFSCLPSCPSFTGRWRKWPDQVPLLFLYHAPPERARERHFSSEPCCNFPEKLRYLSSVSTAFWVKVIFIAQCKHLLKFMSVFLRAISR